MNSDEEVSSIDIASLGVLPEGYTLFDFDGDKTGATHTVVWFAVLWKVQALPDTVVIDYGLPVDISVLANDMFGENGKLAGVGACSDSLNLDGHDDAMASGFGNTYNGEYGSAKADSATGKVRYTPANMQMNGYDAAYANMSTYSLGSAMKATVDYDRAAQASFTFYGTGFDIISLTDSTTGMILLAVYEVNEDGSRGARVRGASVDTYYGYTTADCHVVHDAVPHGLPPGDGLHSGLGADPGGDEEAPNAVQMRQLTQAGSLPGLRGGVRDGDGTLRRGA